MNKFIFVTNYRQQQLYCEKWTDEHDMTVGQRKNLSPDRIQTRDLPNTTWVLYPLSYIDLGQPKREVPVAQLG